MKIIQPSYSVLAFPLAGLIGGFFLASSACTRTESAPENVRVEDIKENPTAYLGKAVTVSGEIERVYGPRAFQLGGTEFFDSEIRVLTAQPLKQGVRRRAEEPFAVDDIALVTGTVRNIVVADVEREFSFDLSPNYEVELENKLAIVASSVLISPRGQNVSSATVSAKVSDIQVIFTSADKISLVGKQIELGQVTVQSLVGDQSFWVGPTPNQQVFVTFAEIPQPGKAQEGHLAIQAGQKLDLRGVIRTMPSPSHEWLKRNKIDDKAATILRQQSVYIHATDIKVLDNAG
ncbi:MAG TPA: hypothetical protein VE954_15740 [Oligoflexus sp.]|uniref:hypothetical protein n=1 Tax=Oligoflexus sp. TaxID=1971216 RepID=UPI002D6C9BB0|nr:hypothetical protein [Oligoflexus sp.]HYX34554.1 hypothetical protein [Oligoflexus sp.]